MVKVRPVVVISPRRRLANLATVVPMSSTAPSQIAAWHYLLPAGTYPPARGPVWVKADMLATVALDRLDRVKVRAATGGRSYEVFQLPPACLAAVRLAVKAALGLS